MHLKTTAVRYIDQMEGHHLANGVGSVFKIKADVRHGRVLSVESRIFLSVLE